MPIEVFKTDDGDKLLVEFGYGDLLPYIAGSIGNVLAIGRIEQTEIGNEVKYEDIIDTPVLLKFDNVASLDIIINTLNKMREIMNG